MYTQCPNCGQKALSVATQCPHCGVPFEIRHDYRIPRPRPRIPLIVLVVVALTMVMLGVDFFRRSPGPGNAAPAAPAVAKAKDSIRKPGPEARSSRARPVESPPTPTPRSRTTGEVARAVSGAQKPSYTKIWVNVRRARRPTATVVKVLRPGEPVLVDSLREGWYRVVADGEGVGYVYRAFVDTVPPQGLP
jgi:hypothetical protein